MLRNFQNEPLAVVIDLEGVLNSRKVAVKLDIDNSADGLTVFANIVRQFVLLRE